MLGKQTHQKYETSYLPLKSSNLQLKKKEKIKTTKQKPTLRKMAAKELESQD